MKLNLNLKLTNKMTNQTITRRQALKNLLIGGAVVVTGVGVASCLNMYDKRKSQEFNIEKLKIEKAREQEILPLKQRNQKALEELKIEYKNGIYEQEVGEGEDLPDTRGIKNYNPGNIRSNGVAWKGLVGKDNKGFCKFESHEYGLRNLAKNIQTYDKKHGLDTIEEIISRWAPANENDTNRYINFVSKQTGYNPKQELNLEDKKVLGKITKAIANYDSGAKYSDKRISKALDLL